MDLDRQLKFPQLVAKTALRVDILLVSEATKNVVILELTVSWEDRKEEASEWKRENYYKAVVSDCHKAGGQGVCLWWTGAEALQNSPSAVLTLRPS